MMDFTPPERRDPPRRDWSPGRSFGDRPRRPASSPVAESKPPTGKAGVSIHINLSKPQFKRLKRLASAAREHISRRQLITTVIILVILGGGWAALAIRKHQLDQRALTHPNQSLANPGTAGTLDLPSFVPAVPGAKQELLTPDGIHSQYDKTKGSYGFVDTIQGKQFTVSEQRIGGSLGTGQPAIDKVAKSLKATTPLKTGWGTAYVLTNKKYNSQSLVFGVRDLLIFIQAPFILTNDLWTTYINNME